MKFWLTLKYSKSIYTNCIMNRYWKSRITLIEHTNSFEFQCLFHYASICRTVDSTSFKRLINIWNFFLGIGLNEARRSIFTYFNYTGYTSKKHTNINMVHPIKTNSFNISVLLLVRYNQWLPVSYIFTHVVLKIL